MMMTPYLEILQFRYNLVDNRFPGCSPLGSIQRTAWLSTLEPGGRGREHARRVCRLRSSSLVHGGGRIPQGRPCNTADRWRVGAIAHKASSNRCCDSYAWRNRHAPQGQRSVEEMVASLLLLLPSLIVVGALKRNRWYRCGKCITLVGARVTIIITLRTMHNIVAVRS
jgi:hypothetical protein